MIAYCNDKINFYFSHFLHMKTDEERSKVWLTFFSFSQDFWVWLCEWNLWNFINANKAKPKWNVKLFCIIKCRECSFLEGLGEKNKKTRRIKSWEFSGGDGIWERKGRIQITASSSLESAKKGVSWGILRIVKWGTCTKRVYVIQFLFVCVIVMLTLKSPEILSE